MRWSHSGFREVLWGRIVLIFSPSCSANNVEGAVVHISAGRHLKGRQSGAGAICINPPTPLHHHHLLAPVYGAAGLPPIHSPASVQSTAVGASHLGGLTGSQQCACCRGGSSRMANSTRIFCGMVFIIGLLSSPVDSKRNRGSQGAIPHPDKSNPNESEQQPQPQPPQAGSGSRQRQGSSSPADEVLESSQEALHITERQYLKRDWCKTQPLKQTIHEEGCVSRTIINRFCYGQCNSFYIPRHIRREEGAFQSCSFCKPKRFTTMTFTLNCPDQQPPTKKKRIQRVKQCRCISIDLD
ncbi:gremlin-1 isoform X2 [Pleuronectes platessa]|uniref:gremlin-1 isoform X2 n=1 Tax=Pleuronectes platessa TaxID=8262 RepID=UPI00232A6DE7|nr:gremlin-1 isoform X2 [Pleuronectes platessa]